MRTAVGMMLIVAGMASCREEAAPDALYRIEAPPVTLPQGGEGVASVRFVAQSGYHWNEEFPAKVEIQEAPGLEVPKKRFASADIASKQGTGVLAIPLKAASQGAPRRVVRATADFSVCNQDECRIFKGVRLEVPVDVH